MNNANKLTWQTFFVLLLGFLILFTSAFFITTAYWRLNRSYLTPERISHEIIRIVKLAKNIKPDKLIASQSYLRHPGVWTTVTQIKPKGLLPLVQVNLNVIRAEILKNPNKVELTFPLENNYYLHIKTHIVRKVSLQLQFYSALFVWFFALIGFCYYIVRRLSLPLTHFINGANRFSQDINAPPIAETGPKLTKAAFMAFNKMQANLKRLIQSRTQMLAAISHDLRTPITRLKLRLENLPETSTTQKMQNDLNRMESMIQSILSFAEHEYQHEQVANIEIDALCESICEDLRDTKMPIEYHGSSEKLIVVGRTLALRRALTNLIINGVKYGFEVTVKTEKQNNFAKISISDIGPGIPDQELEKVFLPFYRLDKARQEQTGGSGLGLATARDIIKTHGGNIQLFNLPGKGLNVIVQLPIK